VPAGLTAILMTNYIFIALAVALAAAGFLLRKKSFLAGQVMIVVGCLGCAGVLVWQLRENVFTPSAQGPDRGQAVVSYYLATQVLGETASKQGSVFLFFPPESVLDSETVGTYAGTFSRVLRGFPGLKVEVLTLDVPSRAAKAGQIPLSAFQQAASNALSAVALVSFAGVPADIEKFLPGESPGGMGMFVFDPWGTTNWLGALKKGRVRSVIVPRPGVRHGAGTEVSGDPQEVFNQLYLMATPATADKIADEMRAK
jgi:hypothetical protein